LHFFFFHPKNARAIHPRSPFFVFQIPLWYASSYENTKEKGAIKRAFFE
jgi:hypothetical protein